MTQLHIERADAHHIRLCGLDPIVLHCLFEVPSILEKRDHPDVQRRLYPEPAPSHPHVNQEWRQWVQPELRHLFASAGEIFAQDLATLAATGSGGTPAVRIADEHVSAWMSALNQARLILGELHQVTEADMERRDLDPRKEKDRAVLTIHVLGYVLQLLVDWVSGDTEKEEAAP